MEKKIFKRFLASFLALILIFLCGCFPSAFASEGGGSVMPSDVKAVAIGDALAELGGIDGGWALTLMTYLSANGISLESYGNDGEDLTNVLMKYYREYYSTSPAGIAGIAVGDFIADAISGTALGISRIVGAVNGAFNLLIRAPLAAELHDFLDWWNEKFNPDKSTELVCPVYSDSVSSVPLAIPLRDGGTFRLTVLSDGVFLDISSLSPNGVFTANLSDFVLGDFMGPLSITYFLNNSRFVCSNQYLGTYSRYDMLSSSYKTVNSYSYGNSPGFYIFLTNAGLNFGFVLNDSSNTVRIWLSSLKKDNFPYYSYDAFFTDGGFSSSGLSSVVMLQSSDGRLSYGPSGSSAGTIIQSGETISIPVVAPSIEGNAVSFSAVDTVADLLAKALTIVEDSVADAADTVLELPSTVGELIPDIELFDDLEINWADDTPVTLTPSPFPSPSPVPDLPVTVIPTLVLSPWPVSPDQFAVVTSDGRTALVDITDTIKGWTESLTGIYQSYVDLLGSVFGFLPEEIQVLFKWSMAALIFTGIFKRWWWDHH